MDEPFPTPEDLELFLHLDRAATEMGITPCLIGAGAIRLGEHLHWEVRLGRRTRD
jgi:hypothetical protein